MSEKLKGLLDKINQEGIQKAEEIKRAIESKAKAEAQKILEYSRRESAKLRADSEEEIRKMKDAAEVSLKQAARDLILSLKEEIMQIFNKIIATETSKALSSEEIAATLGKLIENYCQKNGEVSDVKVLMKKEDQNKLKDAMLSRLKDRIKEGIEFRPSSNIKAGFSVSFDKGKSFFDFTEEGVADALSAFLNPELSKLLK
ncbi:MAG: hypothetical protein KKC66_01580 [Candidatus Omnitrophica bacterium]|nr:hypothetical protein [Candidatus Omnitrophota bacterium]MBU1932579.1 hypothetical protein [Candidatus Omnitrophota bacterium]